LEETPDTKTFDQFKDKTTSYDFNTYTTEIDYSRLSPEQIKQGERLEAMIG